MANATAKINPGRVASNTFGVIGRNPLVFLGLSFLVYGLPNAGLQYLQGNTGTGSIFGIFTSLFTLISYLLTTFLQATLIVASINDLSDKPVRIWDCMSGTFKKLLPLIGLSVITALGLVFGFLMLIVPGIILYLMWVVTTPILMVEDLGVFSSLGRSDELTSGSKPWIFLLVLAFGIFAWLGTELTSFFESFGVYGGLIGVILVTTLTGAVQGAGIASIYIDLRNEKEGTDTSELAKVFG